MRLMITIIVKIELLRDEISTSAINSSWMLRKQFRQRCYAELQFLLLLVRLKRTRTL
jgi:hypothetical protein